MVIDDNGSHYVAEIDTLEYEGRLWLVSSWLERQDAQSQSD